MTDAVDDFVATVSRGVRRAISQRVRELNGRTPGDEELRIIVATSTRAALNRAGIRDLAALAAGGGQVAAALEATLSEGDPVPAALAAWRETRENATGLVDALFVVP